MITINKGEFRALGNEADVVIECMTFIKSFNKMIEKHQIEIDDFCCLDVQELEKFADNIKDGLEKLDKQGWFEFKQFMFGGDSSV